MSELLKKMVEKQVGVELCIFTELLFCISF